jgi:hypothetical protein
MVSGIALAPAAMLARLLGQFHVLGILPLPLAVTLGIAMARLWLFPCPRCHKLFHLRNWYRPPDLFRENQCPHCGIATGTHKG